MPKPRILALEATVERADLKDGQQILELGCGWGSLSLFIAERFPLARITAVSNSASQRLYIEHAAAERRLQNLRVVTADMNAFEPGQVCDRIVLVEMFEHMSNWSELLRASAGGLRPTADSSFMCSRIAAHPTASSRATKPIGLHTILFTGGIMPSHRLMMGLPEFFAVEQDWRWQRRSLPEDRAGLAR